MSVKVLYERQEPKIYMMPNAAYKMRYYIDNSKDEIGWLGFVDKRENNVYVIEDVFLVKQKVHSATTEMDPNALADLAVELMKTEEGRAKYNKLRLWGHSHVNMSTGASSQDDNQMDDFATSDYFIRLIGNKRGEWNVCLYDYERNVLWSELPLYYYMDIDIKDEDLAKEIEENVSKITYSTGFDTRVSRRYPYYGQKFYYDDDYYDYEKQYGLGKEKEKKEEEKGEEDIKLSDELQPYDIKWKLTNEDIEYIIEYYSQSINSLLDVVSADVETLAMYIEEDFDIKDIDLNTVTEIYNKLIEIWNSKGGSM